MLIKSSLQSSRKGNPEIKLTMSFDKVQFDGGIRQLGILKTGEVLKSIQYVDTLIWILFLAESGLLEALMRMVIFVM